MGGGGDGGSGTPGRGGCTEGDRGQASDTPPGHEWSPPPTRRFYPRPVTGGGARHQPKARVVIAGASGLIGRALCASYRYGGHTVCRLVRREPEHEDERRWDPHRPDPTLVDGYDIVVNLAGSPLNGRWTAARKDAIRT